MNKVLPERHIFVLGIQRNIGGVAECIATKTTNILITKPYEPGEGYTILATGNGKKGRVLFTQNQNPNLAIAKIKKQPTLAEAMGSYIECPEAEFYDRVNIGDYVGVFNGRLWEIIHRLEEQNNALVVQNIVPRVRGIEQLWAGTDGYDFQ